jgi:hypothetical protein
MAPACAFRKFLSTFGPCHRTVDAQPDQNKQSPAPNRATPKTPSMSPSWAAAWPGVTADRIRQLVETPLDPAVSGPDGRPDFHLMQFRHQCGPTAELLPAAPVM